MTPDELRRMDNDDCIIYEKGIKPVKAKKFYYFKHPMAKKMAPFEISHNDIGEKDRGVWRKYNPYNPYVEEKDDTEKAAQDLKVESLDDLFDEPSTQNETAKSAETPTIEQQLQQNQKPASNLEDFTEEAPMLPQTNDDDVYDLQKELEAKFDELFGPIDEG